MVIEVRGHKTKHTKAHALQWSPNSPWSERSRTAPTAVEGRTIAKLEHFLFFTTVNWNPTIDPKRNKQDIKLILSIKNVYREGRYIN